MLMQTFQVARVVIIRYFRAYTSSIVVLYRQLQIAALSVQTDWFAAQCLPASE